MAPSENLYHRSYLSKREKEVRVLDKHHCWAQQVNIIIPEVEIEMKCDLFLTLHMALLRFTPASIRETDALPADLHLPPPRVGKDDVSNSGRGIVWESGQGGVPSL